ncbi:MAG: hypothetical protein H0T54_01355 [Geodermatophilaceae bacterium]|nr:hypothetical protein [Geodermatophilaceae bacterium]
MLTVAAPSSGTEAERAAHRLFTRWDSGVRVLGGIAAFRPYDDPATKRRQSDVVVLVPDGVIVVRLVGSQRQSGAIVTHPTGAWSIGGEVMRIAGGGSNPLPGLRDAQSAVAATLRASGLEPGRVAMLVAVGSGEPVDPQDGQLDDGVIVCPLSEEGLAIGVRRAAALTAAADVRQWTTADVKAALSSVQATGRVPAVEELNAEGFMYSPYILRRPDLVAAASAVAASAAETSAALRAHVQAQQAAPSSAEVDDGGPPTQATRIVDEAPGADVGLSGILGNEAAADRPPPAEMPPVALKPRHPDTEYGIEYVEEFYPEEPEVGEVGDRRRVLRVVAVLVALVLIGTAVFVGFQMFLGGSNGDPQAGVTPSGEQTTTAQLATQQIRDNSYVLALSRDGDTCTGNANGQVADYFDTTDCTSLIRELYTTDIDGVGVLVSVARVTMPDAASAEDFKAIVDSDGTGNIDDLFEAGETLPDGPTELVPGAYSSKLDGDQITVVVVGWLDPAAPGDTRALEDLASQALDLQPAA